MNLVEAAPTWLLAVLSAALVAAAVEDVMRFKISNTIVLVVIAAAAVAVGLSGFSVALWENILVFVALLAGGTLLFSTGKVGGGDVKLLAAVGLWMDFDRALLLLAAVFISGGILALLILTPRLVLRRSNGTAVRDRSKGVPYAVAVALGGIFVIVVQQFEARRSNPLEFPTTNVAFAAVN